MVLLLFAPLSVKSHTDYAFPGNKEKGVVIIQAYVRHKFRDICFLRMLSIDFNCYHSVMTFVIGLNEKLYSSKLKWTYSLYEYHNDMFTY